MPKTLFLIPPYRSTRHAIGGVGFRADKKRRGGDGARPQRADPDEGAENMGDNPMRDTGQGPPVLIKTTATDYSKEDLAHASPALVLRGDTLTTVIELSRTAHGPKRQKPLSQLSENVGKFKDGRAKTGNEYFNQSFDMYVKPVVEGKGSSAPARR